MVNMLAEYNPLQNDTIKDYTNNEFVVMITTADENGNLIGSNNYIAFSKEQMAEDFATKFNAIYTLKDGLLGSIDKACDSLKIYGDDVCLPYELNK
jgi:hypothetical protein